MRTTLATLLLTFALAAGGRAGAGERVSPVTHAQNRAVVLRLLGEAFAQNRMAVADELLAETFVDHTPARGFGRDRAGYLRYLASLRAGAAELKLRTPVVLACGDVVVVHWTVSFVHADTMLGVDPSGDHVSTGGVDVFRVVRGRITERWGALDRLDLVRQLAGIGREEAP